MRRRMRWQVPDPAPPPQDERDAIALLTSIAHAIPRTETAAEAYQFALDRACPAVGASLGSVYALAGVSELMQLAAAYGWPERHRPWLGEMRVRLGFGPSGEAASERRLIAVPDVFEDPTLEDWQEVANELGFRALVAVPMEAGGSVRGVVTFYFAEPGGPSVRQRALLKGVADLLALVAERADLRAQLRRLEAVLADERPSESLRSFDEDNAVPPE